MAKKCPRLKFTVHKDRDGFEIEATRPGSKKTLGTIDVDTTHADHMDRPTPSDQARVTFVSVDASLRRCGLGTELYTRAMKLAQAKGLQLTSDSHRSTNSEGFWQKQLKKGRAVCVDKRRGHLVPGNDTPYTNEDTVDHWDCRRFQMKPGRRRWHA